MIEDANLEELIPKISKRTNLTEASIRNLLHFQADNDISTRLGVLHADLDCILSGEANYNISKLFYLNQADIDNLLTGYDKQFVLGMLVAKLLLDKQ